jgi:hypothetical protein
MVDSSEDARYDAAAELSETVDPNHIVQPSIVPVKDGKWSSAFTLNQQQIYSINLSVFVNVLVIKMI